MSVSKLSTAEIGEKILKLANKINRHVPLKYIRKDNFSFFDIYNIEAIMWLTLTDGISSVSQETSLSHTPFLWISFDINKENSVECSNHCRSRAECWVLLHD